MQFQQNLNKHNDHSLNAFSRTGFIIYIRYVFCELGAKECEWGLRFYRMLRSAHWQLPMFRDSLSLKLERIVYPQRRQTPIHAAEVLYIILMSSAYCILKKGKFQCDFSGNILCYEIDCRCIYFAVILVLGSDSFWEVFQNVCQYIESRYRMAVKNVVASFETIPEFACRG
jgi:hypothetical protein